MTTKKLTRDEKRLVRIQSLADKYFCSRQYVRQVLDGDSPTNSLLAQKIMIDANDILNVLERETQVTV